MANDTAHRKYRRSASDEEDDRSSKRHKHRHHRRHHRHRHSSNKNEEESCRDQEDSVPPVANRWSRPQDDVEEGEILEEDESGVRENESAMKEADMEFGELEADKNSDRIGRPTKECHSVDESSNIEANSTVKEGAVNSPQDQKTSKVDSKFYNLDKDKGGSYLKKDRDKEIRMLDQTKSDCKHGNDVSFSISEMTGIKYNDLECCREDHLKDGYDHKSMELDERQNKQMLSPSKGGIKKISNNDHGKVATDGSTLSYLKRPQLERAEDKSQDLTPSTSLDRFIDTSDCRSRSRSNCHSRGQSHSRETVEEEAESRRRHHHGWDHPIFDDKSKIHNDLDDGYTDRARKEGRQQSRDTKDRRRSKTEVDRDWSKENEMEKTKDKDRGIDKQKYDERERGRSRDRRKEMEQNRSKERELERDRRRERDVERDRRVKEREVERDRRVEREREVERDRRVERDRELERDRRVERDRGCSKERELDWDRRAEKERCRSRDREGNRDRRREMEKDRSKDTEVDWNARRDRERDRNDDKAEYSDRNRDRERVREMQKDRFRDTELDRERRDNRNKNEASDIVSSKDKYGNLEHGYAKGSKQPRHYDNESGQDGGQVNAVGKHGSFRRISLEGGEDKLVSDHDEEEEDGDSMSFQLADQEEEDLNRIKEESRRRRQAILEKYKCQQLEKQVEPSLKQSEKDKDSANDSSQSEAAAHAIPKLVDGAVDDSVADSSFVVEKSPRQNGVAASDNTAGTKGLGEGTPKAEGSDGLFCDDIFGETPAAVRKMGKGDGLQIERSGLHDNWDDADGYYNYRFGEVLDSRYEIAAAHGKGVFSTVVRAKDLKAGHGEPEEVAIKILRSNETMYKAGLEELVILKKLVGADPDDKRHCVRFLSSFKYRNHLCLVFESLHMNLREVLKKFGRNIGLKLTAVRAYAKQLFIALKHLRNCGVLHCDIKPDNMLVNEGKNVLKLCDFGNAMFAGKNEITPYLVSRFYRAPEIILGLPYDHPMDIWSVGCCLYELSTGKVLFPGPSNNDMLRLHMELKGPFQKKMLRKGAFTEQHFDQDLNFHASEEDPVTKKTIKRIIVNIKPKDIGSIIRGSPGEDPKMLANFKDLLDKIFVLDPEKRMTVSQALNHPFITVFFMMT
ncbi:serine/threonine-protein kinase prpf4B-like isoform X1 [Cucurbita pepo subsp. pepo]|uniref:serine/threonine-protein kinase prpf4B-like isoform X1 n=3 Tax=Cucurbita pepo subsp. pepo TaxID=3664 RepID=UPI000C9D72D0|nr:serine/threonine-protein kinase prpf4B-like isoform X1 [Cucurbita pepo subsp. pepo]XP_023539272.1 serine/threonine-protein kinase prpf4B-like isoform X1 [Cucurbita pepo subsp. pepo]